MTVAELIQKLKKFNQNLEVVVPDSDSGIVGEPELQLSGKQVVIYADVYEEDDEDDDDYWDNDYYDDYYDQYPFYDNFSY